MDDVKLLPCPFCGGPAGYYGNAVRYVYCQDRECVGWTVLRADAAAWNRRTPASDGRAEGLREAATDRVTDWLVPEMADEITRLRAEVERLREAERTAWERGRDAAAQWHDERIAILDEQIAENNAYAERTGAAVFEANKYCGDLKSAHRLAAHSIRALSPEASHD